eukprot:105569-Hanusia_phi.AAC.2
MALTSADTRDWEPGGLAGASERTGQQEGNEHGGEGENRARGEERRDGGTEREGGGEMDGGRGREKGEGGRRE